MYAGIPKGETAASHMHQPYLTTEALFSTVGRTLSLAYMHRWEVLFLKNNYIIKDSDRKCTKLGDTLNLSLENVYRSTLKASPEISVSQVIFP